jgi:hypothetical protein
MHKASLWLQIDIPLEINGSREDITAVRIN